MVFMFGLQRKLFQAAATSQSILKEIKRLEEDLRKWRAANPSPSSYKGVMPVPPPISSPSCPTANTSKPPPLPPPLPGPKPEAERAKVTEPEDPVTILAENAWNWVKTDWMLKLGALRVFLGLGWLGAYATWNGWLSLEMRLLGATLIGAGFLGAGARAIQKNQTSGLVTYPLGLALLYSTLFWGGVVKPILHANLLIGGWVGLTLGTVMFAVSQKAKALPRIALTAALLLPLLPATLTPDGGNTNHQLLHGSPAVIYLLLILGACALTGKLVEDRWLPKAGALGVAILSPFIGISPAPLLILPIGATCIMALGSTRLWLNKQETSKATWPEIAEAAVIAIFLTGWATWARQPWVTEPRTLPEVVAIWTSTLCLIIGIAAIVAIGAEQGAKNKEGTLVGLWSIGFIMLMGMNPSPQENLAIKGATLALAALLMVVGSWKITKSAKLASCFTIFLAPSLATAWVESSGLNWSPAAVTALALGAGAFLVSKNAKTQGGNVLVTGTLSAFIWVWATAHNFLPEDAASTLSWSTYALTGIVAYLVGIRKPSRAVEVYGTTIVLVVCLRLVTVDMWQLPVVYRVLCFGLIGALLMAGAWLKKTQKAGGAVEKGNPQT